MPHVCHSCGNTPHAPHYLVIGRITATAVLALVWQPVTPCGGFSVALRRAQRVLRAAAMRDRRHRGRHDDRPGPNGTGEGGGPRVPGGRLQQSQRPITWAGTPGPARLG